jgi:hypothetical protein
LMQSNKLGVEEEALSSASPSRARSSTVTHQGGMPSKLPLFRQENDARQFSRLPARAQTPRNASSGLPASVADDVGSETGSPSPRVALDNWAYVARDAPPFKESKGQAVSGWLDLRLHLRLCGPSACRPTGLRPPLFPDNTESSILAQLYAEFRLSAVLFPTKNGGYSR